MLPLSKKQLAFLATSTADGNVRPQLQYIYYLADNKACVSTSVFQLHELSIDLGDKDIIFDTKGNDITTKASHFLGKFPSYLSFFPDTDKYPILLYPENLKELSTISKYMNHRTIIDLIEGTARTNPSQSPDRFISYDIKMKIGKTQANFPHIFHINSEYLYESVRYLDGIGKKHTKVNVSQKSEPSPFVIYSSIDHKECRALIMPLKS